MARSGAPRTAAHLASGALVTALLLTGMACAASSSGSTAAAAQYTVGGTVSGLSGTLVLADNGGDRLSLRGSGTFTFTRPLGDGLAYHVTVAAAPSGQTCTVSGGLGTVTAADVTAIVVDCETNTPPLAADAFRGRTARSAGPGAGSTGRPWPSPATPRPGPCRG